MFRLFSVISIAILTTLVAIPSKAVTWTCYDGNGSNWQMELPENYWPTWADCEAWRYGNPMPTPTPTPSELNPTPTEQPSPEPSESFPSSPTPIPSSSEQVDDATPEPSSPSPSPSDTPYPTSYPEVPELPVQEPSEPDPVVLPESSTPAPSPLPDVQDISKEVVDSSFSEQPLDDEILPLPLPSSLDEENQVQPLLFSESVSFLGVDITLPPLLSEAAQQVFEAINSSLETISNLGSEFTPKEREQAQQVVLGAIIITQLAAPRRLK